MAEGTLTIRFLGDTSKLKGDLDSLGGTMGTFEGKIEGASSKFGTFATVASGIVAAGALQKIGGFLRDGAQGAADDAAAMEILKTAVENTGVAFDTRSQAIDDAIKKGQDLAFSDGDIMAALTSLTTATGDSDEALRRLGLAQDLARGTGMSLEQASKLLGKTTDEYTATLARYGIQLGENATAQDVMNEVDKRFGGQAAAFAESDAGKWAQLQLQMTELQETIGGALIPAITALVTVFAGIMTAIDPVTNFLSSNAVPVIIIVATTLTGVLIPALVAWAVTMWTVTLPAIVATLTALAPFIAVALAIGIAVAALYLAWDSNFLGIRDITQQVIDFIGPYVTTAIDALKVAVETTIGALAVIWDTTWLAVQTTIETVWGAIGPFVQLAIDAVSLYIQTEIAALQLIWDGIWWALKTTVDGVMTGIQTAIGVLDAIKSTISTVVTAIRDEVWNPVWQAISDTVTKIFGVGIGIYQAIDETITGIKDTLKSTTDTIKSNWDGFWDGMASKVGGVKDAIVGFVNGIIGGINALIVGWNSLSFSTPSVSIAGQTVIPSFTWNSPDVPLIPTLAAGGIVTKPTLAIIGEAGPEAIVPLSSGNSAIRPLDSDRDETRERPTSVVLSPHDVQRQAAAIAAAVERGVEKGLRRALSGAI